MERAPKVSNVHLKFISSKKRLTITFTGNTLPHWSLSRKCAENFIVDKVSCHQHATLPKLNSPATPLRNLNNSCTKLLSHKN